MRKTNTKTSLSITLNQNGSSQTYLKWSDLDVGHHREASERILAALTKVPDYEWLWDELLEGYLFGKYCEKCKNYNTEKPCVEEGDRVAESENPFPYCFIEKKQGENCGQDIPQK